MRKLLAENMLRFGPKVLSDSNVHRLKLLAEDIKPIQPENWPEIELRWFSCSAGSDYDREVENKSAFKLVDSNTENPKVEIVSVPTEVHDDINKPEGEYYSIQTCVMGAEKDLNGEWKIDGKPIIGFKLNLAQYSGADGPYHLEMP